MKITLRFLVKALIVILLLVFVGPMLLSIIDRPSGEKGYVEHRRKVKHQDSTGGPNIANPVGLKDLVNKIKIPLQPPQGNLAGRQGVQPLKENNIVEKAETPVKEKAVFNDGVKGNFEPEIKPQKGPGENGEPVYVSIEEKPAADHSTHEFGFNMVASDKIAMNRTIPDTRLDECQFWTYPESLPQASVILVFHNEGWSTLMRTVHSVINTSPKHLLKEVVMVDDFSSKTHLKEKLEEYLKQFNGLVKLYRNEKREGLIRTRTAGARYATGEVIIFLDAHCECNRNWLVPLLARIKNNRKTMAVPTIDGIDWNTFRISPVYGHGSHYRGIFEWGFLYKESSVPKRELDRRQYHSEPYWAPTHAGGLFAMDREYFFELGAYDDGLLIWGGENFELSFKIWQCGGVIEWVPCSRVAHVYRNHMPYGFGNIDSKIPIIQVNYMRVVEVWLDDKFKEYFYTREPAVRGYDIGDISKQLKFKKDHNCKSFEWFMNNIAYEVYDRFPPPPPNAHWGQIIEEQGQDCWDAMGWSVGRQVELHGCHKQGGSQLLRLNTEGQLASGERCLIPRSGHVEIIVCPVQPSGDWHYDEDTKQLKDKKTGKCAGRPSSHDRKIDMQTCVPNSARQKFLIQEVRQF